MENKAKSGINFNKKIMKKCVICGAQVTDKNSDLCNECGEAALEAWYDPTSLMNWRQISMILSGNYESIRKDRIPERYFNEVAKLFECNRKWMLRQIKKPNSRSPILRKK